MLHGRQHEHAHEPSAIRRREDDVLETPSARRGGSRRRLGWIEQQALLPEPDEYRDGDIRDGAGEQEELQRAEGSLSAGGPKRP